MLRLQEIGEKDATSNYKKVKVHPLLEINSQ
jgi:hypothetical protein